MALLLRCMGVNLEFVV